MGVRSLLASVFYESGIACNVVNPWLQSIFAVLDSVTDDRILAYIMMSRVPHIAPLWLGGIIMGIQKGILEEARNGLLPFEIHAAVWSGTFLSFMQEPVARYPMTNGSILRSDECRLLYLTQGESHTRFPMGRWVLFGATAVEDTDIDVRSHGKCSGHGLRYGGFKWACRNGKVVCTSKMHQPSNPDPPTDSTVGI